MYVPRRSSSLDVPTVVEGLGYRNVIFLKISLFLLSSSTNNFKKIYIHTYTTSTLSCHQKKLLFSFSSCPQQGQDSFTLLAKIHELCSANLHFESMILSYEGMSYSKKKNSLLEKSVDNTITLSLSLFLSLSLSLPASRYLSSHLSAPLSYTLLQCLYFGKTDL